MKIFLTKKSLDLHDIKNRFEGFAEGVDALAKEIMDYSWKNNSLEIVVELLTKGNNKIYQAIRSAIYNYGPAKGSALYNMAVNGRPASVTQRPSIGQILGETSPLGKMLKELEEKNFAAAVEEINLGGNKVKVTVAGTSPDFEVKYQASNDNTRWRDVDPSDGLPITEKFVRTVIHNKRFAGEPRTIPIVRMDVRPGEQLKFKNKDYQVRIFVNDPVTLCQIKKDGEWMAEGSTIRNPKDKWNGKVAITKALYSAASLMTTNTENADVKSIVKSYFDALFKKYPELKRCGNG